MKVGIIGSRNFNRVDILIDSLNLLRLPDNSIIVSGGARGADSMGEQWAKSNSFQTLIFPANWDKYGKRAGFLRNEDIIKNSDIVVAFWDGVSNGTRHSLGLAKKYKKPTFIVYF